MGQTLIGVGTGQVVSEAPIQSANVIASIQFSDCLADNLNQIFQNMLGPTNTSYNFITANCGNWATQMLHDAATWIQSQQ